MQVHLLHFADLNALSRAFGLIVECSRVGSCMIEPEYARLRFVAEGSVASELIDQVYADGGLVWCTRHEARWLEGRCGVMRPATDRDRDRDRVAEDRASL